MSEPLLSFEHVEYGYEPNLPAVLHDVSFELSPNTFTVIVGPSGSGKSTILSLIVGLEKPSKGSVRLSARTRMIFQSGALLPWRTVLDNVKLGFNGMKVSVREADRRAREALNELGIDSFAKMYPRDLSGGQRQRVGIARALVSEPELMLLDEPFSALDAETASRLTSEIEVLFEKKQMTFLMVSHSIEDAVLLADEIFVVAEGGIRERIKVPLPRPRRAGTEEVDRIAAHVRSLIPSF